MKQISQFRHTQTNKQVVAFLYKSFIQCNFDKNIPKIITLIVNICLRRAIKSNNKFGWMGWDTIQNKYTVYSFE